MAEATLLDMLADLPAVAAAPILVICLSRPELLDHHQVASYGPPGTAQLAGRCAPREPARRGAAPVRTRIARVSAGNPLFVEELVAMLLDEGVLRLEDGTCKLEGDLDTFALPVSLSALLGARLDRLEPAARRTRARRDRR